MKRLIFSLLAIAVLSAASGKQTFTGTITDSVCANAPVEIASALRTIGIMRFIL